MQFYRFVKSGLNITITSIRSTKQCVALESEIYFRRSVDTRDFEHRVLERTSYVVYFLFSTLSKSDRTASACRYSG